MTEEEMQLVNKFWKEGQDAFVAGIPESDNPYKNGSKVAKSGWRCGWICAKGGIFYV